MRLRILAIAILAFLSLPSFFVVLANPPQQNAAPAQEKTTAPSTFRTTTELVVVPAIVRGKSGHIPDLKKEDFILLEDGKPRDISVFEEVRSTPEVVQRVAVPEGEFTNELRGTNSAKRLTVIAIDEINTAPLDMTYVREALRKFIQQSGLANQPTALVVLEARSLRLIYDFTVDPRKLSDALVNLNSKHPRTPETSVALDNNRPAGMALDVASTADDPSSAARQLEAWIDAKEGEQNVNQFLWRSNRFSTVDALEHLATWLQAVPGRKSLVWITGGMPFGGNTRIDFNRNVVRDSGPSGETLALYGRLWDRLNEANVAVYPVDARRMVNTAFDVMSPEHKYSPLYVDKQAAQAREVDRTTTFETMAGATGGKPCYGTGDLTKCFFEASKDSADYYQIGYYLDRNTTPGWHKIDLKCKQDGSHVRTRAGFYYGGLDPDAERKQDVQLAIYSPLQASGLAFRGKWTGQIPKENGKRRVSFELQLPSASVTIDQGTSQMSLEVVAVAFDKKGKVAASLSQRISNKVTPQAMEEIRRSGIRYTNALEVPPGEYVVRFVVRDNASGRVGSVLVATKAG